MKLKITADIIYDYLSQEVTVKRYGTPSHNIALRRPVFFERGRIAKSGDLYIARLKDLPPPATIEAGVTLVCVGGVSPQGYMRSRFDLLVLDESMDILSVFNLIQEAFNFYEAWDAECRQHLESDVELSAIIRASVSVLQNPVYLTDANLYFVVQTVDIKSRNGRLQSFSIDDTQQPLPIDMVKACQFPHLQSESPSKPYFISDAKMYCTELFAHKHYVGSLIVDSSVHPFRNSDFQLIAYLAQILTDAQFRYHEVLGSHTDTMRTVIHDLLNCFPVGADQIQQVLHDVNNLENPSNQLPPQFLCFKLKRSEKAFALPTTYICNSIERLFPHCVSMLFESTIVSFVNMTAFPYTYEEFIKMLELLLSEIECQAGLSVLFTDLLQVRLYFRQACCAFETGVAIEPDNLIYPFSKFTLPYMLSNCVGEFSAELLCPPELLQLRSDGESSVDYWSTLRIYLDNEMNAAKTARDLFIHRSTLLQRLNHINECIDTDWEDPDQRLYLRLCMRLLENPS